MFNLKIEFEENGFPVCDRQPDMEKDHMNPKNFNKKGTVGEQHLCLITDSRSDNKTEIMVLKPYQEPVPTKYLHDYPDGIHREWFDEDGNPWSKPGDREQVIGFTPIRKVSKSTLRLLNIKINEDW